MGVGSDMARYAPGVWRTTAMRHWLRWTSLVFFVAFVDRALERRIISLRKVNAREVKRYAET